MVDGDGFGMRPTFILGSGFTDNLSIADNDTTDGGIGRDTSKSLPGEPQTALHIDDVLKFCHLLAHAGAKPGL